VKGDTVLNEFYGVYGSQGVPDTANKPGARLYATGWADKSGHIFLFGGFHFYRVFNDLWKFQRRQSLNTDYFRSISSGNWNSTTVWESSPVPNFSSGIINPSTLAPDINAAGITILYPHSVIITQNASANKLTVQGIGGLSVKTGVNFVVK
jgi:hypothetical protein